MNTTFLWSEGGVDIEGEFGAWNLMPKGSNKLLRCRVPFKKGSIRIDQQEYKLDAFLYGIFNNASHIIDIRAVGAFISTVD
jgi:hypothetical protein